MDYLDELRLKLAGVKGLPDPPAPKAPKLPSTEKDVPEMGSESLKDNTLLKYVVDYEVPSLKNIPQLKQGMYKEADGLWGPLGQSARFVGEDVAAPAAKGVFNYGLPLGLAGLGAYGLYRGGQGVSNLARYGGMNSVFGGPAIRAGAQRTLSRSLANAAPEFYHGNVAEAPRNIVGTAMKTQPIQQAVRKAVNPNWFRRNILRQAPITTAAATGQMRSALQGELAAVKATNKALSSATAPSGATGLMSKMKGNPMMMLIAGMMLPQLLRGFGGGGQQQQQAPTMTMPMMTMPQYRGRW